jgi:hypothetical protein
MNIEQFSSLKTPKSGKNLVVSNFFSSNAMVEFNRIQEFPAHSELMNFSF